MNLFSSRKENLKNFGEVKWEPSQPKIDVMVHDKRILKPSEGGNGCCDALNAIVSSTDG